MQCPKCGNQCKTAESCKHCTITTYWHDQKCPKCGTGWPAYDTRVCSVPDGGCGYEAETVTVVREANSDLPPICPKCGKQFPIFDGWDCQSCGHKIPEKARKVHGRRLSEEEAANLRKELGFSE